MDEQQARERLREIDRGLCQSQAREDQRAVTLAWLLPVFERLAQMGAERFQAEEGDATFYDLVNLLANDVCARMHDAAARRARVDLAARLPD